MGMYSSLVASQTAWIYIGNFLNPVEESLLVESEEELSSETLLEHLITGAASNTGDVL